MRCAGHRGQAAQLQLHISDVVEAVRGVSRAARCKANFGYFYLFSTNQRSTDHLFTGGIPIGRALKRTINGVDDELRQPVGVRLVRRVDDFDDAAGELRISSFDVFCGAKSPTLSSASAASFDVSTMRKSVRSSFSNVASEEDFSTFASFLETHSCIEIVWREAGRADPSCCANDVCGQEAPVVGGLIGAPFQAIGRGVQPHEIPFPDEHS